MWYFVVRDFVGRESHGYQDEVAQLSCPVDTHRGAHWCCVGFQLEGKIQGTSLLQWRNVKTNVRKKRPP